MSSVVGQHIIHLLTLSTRLSIKQVGRGKQMTRTYETVSLHAIGKDPHQNNVRVMVIHPCHHHTEHADQQTLSGNFGGLYHDKQAHMQGALTMMMTVAYTSKRNAGTCERCSGASRARSEAERKGTRV